jgi:hypothetical protein
MSLASADLNITFVPETPGRYISVSHIYYKFLVRVDDTCLFIFWGNAILHTNQKKKLTKNKKSKVMDIGLLRREWK